MNTAPRAAPRAEVNHSYSKSQPLCSAAHTVAGVWDVPALYPRLFLLICFRKVSDPLPSAVFQISMWTRAQVSITE